MQIVFFYSNFTEICFQMSNHAISGLDNDSLPNRRWQIIWTNDGLVSFMWYHFEKMWKYKKYVIIIIMYFWYQKPMNDWTYSHMMPQLMSADDLVTHRTRALEDMILLYINLDYTFQASLHGQHSKHSQINKFNIYINDNEWVSGFNSLQ